MKTGGVRRKAGVLAFLSLAAALVSAIPASGVVLDCTIKIALSPTRTAVVSEFSGANATFPGYISVTKPSPWVGNITLHLSGTTLASSIQPGQFEVGAGEQLYVEFIVNVTVPAAQPERDWVSFIVDATAQLGGGTCSVGGGHATAHAKAYYAEMTGAVAPDAVLLSQENPRATVAVNVSQATNEDPRFPVQAWVDVRGILGLNFSAPRLVNMSQSRPGHDATTFNVTIESRNAPPGAYEVIVNVTSNAFGTVSVENRSGVDVVIRVVVERPLAALQVTGATAVGGTALAALAFWLWKERRERRGNE
jgi:hypothetical protein